MIKNHPESFKSYAIRRIDRLYLIADDPNTLKERAIDILAEIKQLSKELNHD